jgi:hypothetical protein
MYNNNCTISYKILSHELTIRKQRNFALLHFRRYQGGVCNDASSSEPAQGQQGYLEELGNCSRQL